MAEETSMTADELLARLEAAVARGIADDDWTVWKDLQDRHLTYDLKVGMSDEQRIRLHELTHGVVTLADPDGAWSQRLSERLDRELRATAARTGASA
jgi:hypothetical protein